MSARFFFLIISLVLLPQLPSWGFCLTSPDRPAVWYNRSGDKLSQNLRWSKSRDELVLYVSYNSVAYTAPRDQLLVDTFKLSFPDVRLDRMRNNLYFVDLSGRKISIGHLAGISGDKAVLYPGVQVSAHRQNGVIVGSIMSGDAASAR